MTTSTDANPHGAISQGGADYFRADQIVVGLPYADLVLRELGDYAALTDRDDRLGLALLDVRSDAVLASLRDSLRVAQPTWVDEAIADSRAALAAANPGGDRAEDGTEPSSLDVTVRLLRRLFADRYAGWVPTLGKNRIVGRVVGSYVIDGGGIEGPFMVTGNYVIDGGGIEGPTSAASDQVLVPLRKRQPGAGVRVGVVDTRLDAHPWLAGGYLAGAADILPARLAQPLPAAAAHATFITGLVLRQAPGAVVELRAGLADDGAQDSWAVARTITALAGSGTQIINLSLGCHTDDGQPPLVLSAALGSLGPETVVVAAAGNHGRADDASGSRPASRPVWPAAFDNVIAVGALDGDELAPFTPRVPWLDVVAPGVDLVSTVRARPEDAGEPAGGGGFARWSGTSFAAAAVSGALAARIRAAEVNARQAWLDLQSEAKRDRGGRPIVELQVLDSWPADGTRD